MRLIIAWCKLDVDLQRPAATCRTSGGLDLGQRLRNGAGIKSYSEVEFSLPQWVS